MKHSEEFIDAMMCAFDEAADNVEMWEFGGADTMEEYQLHRLAGETVAEMIRKMRDRYYKRVKK